MDNHFRAFSFVDRITTVQSPGLVSGSYWIPPTLETFPASLVAEAVGQLAAWSAMAAVDFERRPIAGIAGRIELLSPVRPGQVLELSAEIETVNSDAVAYGGTATVDGRPVLRLQHCVGPMVSVLDFDDPQALRARYNLLCGPGAERGCFHGIPDLVLEHRNGEPRLSASASLHVPASAPLFADHFPRRPVFPGSLIMHANLQLATLLADNAPPAPGVGWAIRTLSDMKLRAFISPGSTLAIEARFAQQADESATLTLETRNGKRVIGGVRVLLTPEKLT